MCLVNKQFEHLEFVFHSVYVDLQYDEISLTFTARYVSLCCVCSHVVVYKVAVVPYVNAVVAVTVMRVLLFVMHVYMVREGEGSSVWGSMRCGCGECMACGWYTCSRYCV